MNRYTAVSIIYNSKSTGSSRIKAQRLAKRLQKTDLNDVVKVIPTKHAGHAEELAYELSKISPRALIISSSGDGGYHEVVNGIMKAQAEGAQPVAGLLPGGNANDHYKNLHQKTLYRQIMTGEPRRIDLIQVTAKYPGGSWSRYAHSYIGIGLTAKVGRELNKTKLNAVNELGISLKTLLKLREIQIVVSGQTRTYDSLIFSNVQKMSKVLQLSDTASPYDGKFEITKFPHQTKLKLVRNLVKAATKGLGVTNRAAKFTFETISPLAIQLDGEVFTNKIQCQRYEIKIVPRRPSLRGVVNSLYIKV